jgi:hypothetical protein
LKRAWIGHGFTLLVGQLCVSFRIAAPAVKRVVKHHPGAQLLEVVVVHARQAERSRKQARRLGRKVEPCGVDRAHHGSEPVQRWCRQAELLHRDVEGAELAPVAPEQILDVEGRGFESLGDHADFGGRNEQE